jgi:two-component system, LytTR family, sensor kinase
MKIKLPRYTSKDYFIMVWVMVPFTIVVNTFVFGIKYFSDFGLFLSATLITIVAVCIDFILCGAVAVTMKNRFPADAQVVKRLAFMIVIFLIISGLFLYFLFSGYEAINFYGYTFNKSGFLWAYLCMGVVNIFLTFLHESISRFERWKANMQETEQLKKVVKQSQLLCLKSHVNPHFLFNCLNSLSSLINECPDEAEKFLDQMSKVYRYMLRNDDDLLIPLERELQFIQSYYALLKARYGEGIQLDIHVKEEYKDAMLPPLSLQVILENAFSQNTMQRSAPLKISIESNNEAAVIIRNNVQPKAVTDTFDYEAGLDNLVNKYRLLNQREVIIRDSKTERTIELPLINCEAEISL